MISDITKTRLVTIIISTLMLTTSASIFNNVTCISNKTFTPNSTFHLNLNTLLSTLSSKLLSGNNIRFFKTFSGENDHSNTVYGLFMCRGDVPFPLCKECVGFATQTIASTCIASKEAIIWYNECLLRYSYRFFFSIMEEWPRHQIKIPLGDPLLLQSNEFYTALGSIFSELANEAALSLQGSSSEQFAVKQANASATTTLYGLAQCTPDLSITNCRRCVTDAAAEFSKSCCGGSIGESVLFPSCIVRYETYPFYQHSGTSLPTIINAGPEIEICSVESLEFDLATIEVATNKFSDERRIGKGGYGQVYKGILRDGEEIAVKRLSKKSGQGGEEYKNEVLLIAKLQHRNLVRLIGFCHEQHEKILIYEYVPNKSLDHFLFDSLKERQLTWPERYKIIKGIARGILYLHEDSRLMIIHRDLKPSNVLIDSDMNPKISDFGMARMVAIDQIQGATNRVVGTFGYMSPEYAMHGQFSVKSDVFSFGVMVLEIISGKKNSCSFDSRRVDDLLSYAWNKWKDELLLDLLDPILQESYTQNEVERCVQIGLLCVQEHPDDRPTMGMVASYLNNVSVEMPNPVEPAFFICNDVYGSGVLVLQVISGKKNKPLHVSGYTEE
ncbi:hypothetical protein TanjilG_24772 [Lupinus angustifolius]|uniref:Cysteine-rich receptor-like protein kinase 10 n=1 Tax=Lupinus angustifolius TaxID=3871 RepID=A0A4P1RL92_LUPAN|nr:hypothetical protein TanjilG_24772 [Lupinus angustifolius]